MTPAKAGYIDLSINVDIGDSTEVIFDQTSNFSIAITNHGPDDAGVDSTSSHPITIISSRVVQDTSGYLDFYLRSDIDLNHICAFVISISEPRPGGSPIATYAFHIATPMIPAHSSVTCFGTYHIGFTQGQRDLSFRVRSALDADIDSDNNDSRIFTFGIEPRIIPFLSPLSLLLLILLVLMITNYRFVMSLGSE